MNATTERRRSPAPRTTYNDARARAANTHRRLAREGYAAEDHYRLASVVLHRTVTSLSRLSADEHARVVDAAERGVRVATTAYDAILAAARTDAEYAAVRRARAIDRDRAIGYVEARLLTPSEGAALVAAEHEATEIESAAMMQPRHSPVALRHTALCRTVDHYRLLALSRAQGYARGEARCEARGAGVLDDASTLHPAGEVAA